MRDQLEVSKQFLEMVSEIVRASKSKISVADYLQDSLFRTLTIGANHDDRIRTISYLCQTGCLQVSDDNFVILQSSPPDWLVQAGAMGLDEAYDLAIDFLPNPSLIEKFDQAVLNEIGLKGELAFIDHLRKNHGAYDEITHVSLFDDSLGYDVIHSDVSQNHFLYEVKTTSRPNSGYFEFFVSRNEFKTSMNASNWRIACMRISKGSCFFEGFVDWENLKHSLPVDQNADMVWSSTRVTVSTANLIPDS